MASRSLNGGNRSKTKKTEGGGQNISQKSGKKQTPNYRQKEKNEVPGVGKCTGFLEYAERRKGEWDFAWRELRIKRRGWGVCTNARSQKNNQGPQSEVGKKGGNEASVKEEETKATPRTGHR